MSQSVSHWLEVLEDVDDATREEAAKALAELGDPTTVEALTSALEDEYWAVRVHVGWAFAKIGGNAAVEALITLFNDNMMEVQREAVDAMASMGNGPLPKLVDCPCKHISATRSLCIVLPLHGFNLPISTPHRS